MGISRLGHDNMEKPQDKVLVCRQCGEEFTFTVGEQDFYIQKGFSQPTRCSRCRSRNRNREFRVLCSGCGCELGGNASAYCSKCVDNLQLEAEFRFQRQQKRIKELETRLEKQEAMETSVAAAGGAVEKRRQTSKELQDTLRRLRLRNQRLVRRLHRVMSWTRL